MSKKAYLQLSVHGLVDVLLRSGDIDSRVYNTETMQMGSLLHAAYQEKQGREYLAEYPLSGEIEADNGIVALQGRADGIILGGKDPIIDEIKSTVAPLELFFEQQKKWHLGQALCYAYLYLQGSEDRAVEIHLTYLSQIHAGEKMLKAFTYTREEVEEIVKGYVHDYFAMQQERFDHIAARDESVKSLVFPYPNFRDGQRELAKYAFGVAKRGGLLFAEAPTGIGKTMSTLYPFVLSFQDKRVERLFYLTAKNTGGYAAYNALGDLYEAGFVGRDSFLFARDKICFNPGHACNPDDCPFAKGYYDKLKKAIAEAVKTYHRFDLLTVSEICRKYAMCPFEFQLDLSLEADVIIADYNYFFDPFVHLERYFDPTVDTSKDLLLIDEAHNLVDRSRSMYSAEIRLRDVVEARKCLKGDRFKSMRKTLKKVEAIFPSLCDEGITEIAESPAELEKDYEALHRAEQKVQKEISGNLPDEYRFLRREYGRYIRLLQEYYNSSFRLYATRDGDDVALHMDCLDASGFLSDNLSRVKGAVLFSATLSPMEYYMKSLLGKDDIPYLLLPSPFPKEHFQVLVAPKVSVRYKDRERSYEEVASYLNAFVATKKGNYFLYFPSYSYLENIRQYLHFPHCNVLTQDRRMSVEEKEDFLASFGPNPQVTTVGLLILGGAFSEGVDLQDDRLIGVAIVGVGLPMVCYENDLLRHYYDEKENDGFDFAYKYPGMNKVTQAVGRVIRSESDVGAALLIDDRYLRGDYRPLLERLWPSYRAVYQPSQVSEVLSSFYKKKED